jgi:hypothetical protein
MPDEPREQPDHIIIDERPDAITSEAVLFGVFASLIVILTLAAQMPGVKWHQAAIVLIALVYVGYERYVAGESGRGDVGGEFVEPPPPTPEPTEPPVMSEEELEKLCSPPLQWDIPYKGPLRIIKRVSDEKNTK